jgi:diguanylate cyclase (GGDEF)-like protein/PAS domain S-box-containing protein
MSIIAFMLTSFRNRAERLAAHMTDELRASETRFRRAFEDAAVGMAVISIDGRFMRVNHAFANMVGYSVGQIQQMVGHEMTHPEDVAQDERVIDDVLTGRCDQFVIEKRYVHRTGRPVWVIHSATLIRGSDGRPDYFISQIQDITERKRMETELRHAALHDKLTGLPDRSVFEQRLKSLWRLRQESSAIFAVLFIDVDRFKQVNDLLGHEAGDALLRQVADRLRQSTRSTDLVSSRADAMPSRVGGDEFTIVVEGLESTEMAIQIALRAQQQLNEPYLLPCGKRPDVSVSVGVATSAGPYEMPEEMVHAADMAMYRAKQNGRGEWVVLADEQRGFRRTEEAEMVAVP